MHVIQEEIASYLKKKKLPKAYLARKLGIHENSILYFFNTKSQNTFNIIEWWLGEIGADIKDATKKEIKEKALNSIFIKAKNGSLQLKDLEEFNTFIDGL